MNEVRNELQKSYGTGYNDGYSKGYEQGRADGYCDGYNDELKLIEEYIIESKKLIEEIAKIIPKAKEGEWIIHFDDLFPEESTMECSICHEYQPLGIDDNYCPYCGSKMKERRKGDK